MKQDLLDIAADAEQAIISLPGEISKGMKDNFNSYDWTPITEPVKKYTRKALLWLSNIEEVPDPRDAPEGCKYFKEEELAEYRAYALRNPVGAITIDDGQPQNLEQWIESLPDYWKGKATEATVCVLGAGIVVAGWATYLYDASIHYAKEAKRILIDPIRKKH